MASSEKKLLIAVDAAFALLGRALLAVAPICAACGAGALDEASGGEGSGAALGAEVAVAGTVGVDAATVGVSVGLGGCWSWNAVDAVAGVEECSSCTSLVGCRCASMSPSSPSSSHSSPSCNYSQGTRGKANSM